MRILFPTQLRDRKKIRLLAAFVGAPAALLILLACSNSRSDGSNSAQVNRSRQGNAANPGEEKMAFAITSASFKDGEEIPKEFTCDGADISPAIAWSDPPAQTQSYALIADDPDAPAGTWVHWVVYDLPAKLRELPQDLSKQGELKSGGRPGINDFHKTGYNGPCPPPGKPHRYFFKLYALDRNLNLKAGASKREVEGAMSGHILAQSQLVGRYGR